MDWFKMQTIWGASIDRLSDAEAGRFIKAIYDFIRKGEEYDGTGKEETLVWQALETLRNDIEKFAKAQADADNAMKAKSEKRREAANKRWQMQRDAKASKPMQNDAFALDAMQNDAKDAYKNKNKNNNNPPTPLSVASDSMGFDSDEALTAIAKDHNEIFQAMEYAGFSTDPADMDKVVALYAKYGKEKVLSAIDACVENSVKKLVYLKGVLESREREEKEKANPVEKPDDKVVWLD